MLTHEPVRAYGGIEVKLHVFVTSEENGFYGRIYILLLYRRTKCPCYHVDRRLFKPKKPMRTRQQREMFLTRSGSNYEPIWLH